MRYHGAMSNVELAQLGDVKVSWEGRTVLVFNGVTEPLRSRLLVAGVLLSMTTALAYAAFVQLQVDMRPLGMPVALTALGGAGLLVLVGTAQNAKRRRRRELRVQGHDQSVVVDGQSIPFDQVRLLNDRGQLFLHDGRRQWVLGEGDDVARVTNAVRGLGVDVAE